VYIANGFVRHAHPQPRLAPPLPPARLVRVSPPSCSANRRASSTAGATDRLTVCSQETTEPSDIVAPNSSSTSSCTVRVLFRQPASKPTAAVRRGPKLPAGTPGRPRAGCCLLAVRTQLLVHDVLDHLGEDLRYLGNLMALRLADFGALGIWQDAPAGRIAAYESLCVHEA
jgi:hypothetical protein